MTKKTSANAKSIAATGCSKNSKKEEPGIYFLGSSFIQSIGATGITDTIS